MEGLKSQADAASALGGGDEYWNVGMDRTACDLVGGLLRLGGVTQQVIGERDDTHGGYRRTRAYKVVCLHQNNSNYFIVCSVSVLSHGAGITPNSSPRSGLFVPELESSTKYCLERGLESSVRLCLTS